MLLFKPWYLFGGMPYVVFGTGFELVVMLVVVGNRFYAMFGVSLARTASAGWKNH